MCPAHDRLPRTDSHPRIPPTCQASAPRASVFCFISAHVCSGADILRALGSNAGLRSSAVCKIPSQRLQVIDFPGQFPCAQLSAQVPQPYSLLSSPSSKFLFLLIHQACPVSMAGPEPCHQPHFVQELVPCRDELSATPWNALSRVSHAPVQVHTEVWAEAGSALCCILCRAAAVLGTALGNCGHRLGSKYPQSTDILFSGTCLKQKSFKTKTQFWSPDSLNPGSDILSNKF